MMLDDACIITLWKGITDRQIDNANSRVSSRLKRTLYNELQEWAISNQTGWTRSSLLLLTNYILLMKFPLYIDLEWSCCIAHLMTLIWWSHVSMWYRLKEPCTDCALTETIGIIQFIWFIWIWPGSLWHNFSECKIQFGLCLKIRSKNLRTDLVESSDTNSIVLFS